MSMRQDKEAFRVLFSRYKHLALGVCLKYLSDEGIAKDAVQDIFLKIWSDSHLYRVMYFKSWFYKVVKNHCLTMLRKKNPSLVDEDILEENGNMELEEDLHLKLKEEDLLAHLDNCMHRLRAEQYKCIHHFYIEEKSYRETALATGFSDKEVKSYIQNGRRNLKLCMQLSVQSR